MVVVKTWQPKSRVRLLWVKPLTRGHAIEECTRVLTFLNQAIKDAGDSGSLDMLVSAAMKTSFGIEGEKIMRDEMQSVVPGLYTNLVSCVCVNTMTTILIYAKYVHATHTQWTTYVLSGEYCIPIVFDYLLCSNDLELELLLLKYENMRSNQTTFR
jgi:hypothetical protein